MTGSDRSLSFSFGKEKRMATTKNVIQLEDATFEQEVLKSNIPVLVDFWAPWCAPCRAIAPVIEEIADAYAGKVKVGKVNVDEHQRYAAQFQITAIPTLLVFKNGKVVHQIVGAQPKQRIVDAIEAALKA